MHLRALGTAILLLGGTSAVHAASYEFLAAPEVDLNRVYRVDKATGEMSACQYGLATDASKDAKASIGTTLCYPPGEGGGPQAQSEYGLVASRHEKEGGVFRVDLRSGSMSICYVLNDAVVCTPPAK
ncbi:hypothetical protein [Lichenifustis flavocetrariae]|uniref:Secreted protein n=1 Tax=Lichenifustis flavocetrariae TaxID=2949735 RepID=A0AA41Z0S1_9HYPH|nr:hypothetical protein [Lichenifustis flavocetrariae]MCW6510740.1 hypothetical protein [Lichenifustis flavocetrariae]